MTDAIMERYTELSLLNTIPDMHRYAMDWNDLAYECDKEGRESTANACRTRAAHYFEQAGGVYVRVVEGSFAELHKTDEETPAYDWQGRSDLK
jgi:hypothetical protein